MKKDKDVLEGKFDILISQKNTEQTNRLFNCTRIEYWHDRDFHKKFGKTFDHHLMFYNGKKLIFKVWLKNSQKDKEFKNVKEALESVGMKIINLEFDEDAR